jgi:hypothetical protein
MHSLLLCLLVAQAPLQTPAPEPTALVTGRVIDGVTGKPVSAAVVGLQSTTVTRAGRAAVNRVLTDEEGRYFFDKLTKGSYLLTATKPGWMDGAFGRRRPGGGSMTLDLAKDDEHRGDVNLMLWKHAAMSGIVVDEAGEPIVDMQVRAVRRRFVAGRQRLEFAGVARTDDRGEFRIAGLAPAEYTAFMPTEVSAGAAMFGSGSAPDAWYQTMTAVGTAPLVYTRESAVLTGDGRNLINAAAPMQSAPGSGVWLSVPPTFLGGGTAASTFFRLDSGQNRTGLSLAVHRVPTQTIAGTLIVPGGSAANHVLHLLPADTSDFPLFEVATAIADAAGAFTFFGVPNGNYVIRIVKSPAPKDGQRLALLNSVRDMPFVATVSNGPGAGGAIDDEPLYFANETVAVNSQPIKGVTISLRPGVRITGRAEFEGTTPHPAADALARIGVTVEASSGYTPRNAPAGRFAADGTFKTASLLPGSYVIHPQGPPGWTVKTVNAGGRDITDRAVDITGDLSDVVVTFTDHPGQITGTVAAASEGSGSLEHVSVLLFPADRESWLNYGAAPRVFASTRAKATGAFMMAAPRPGSYLVAAVPDDQLADWQDPATLAKLAAVAKSLDLRDGESPVVALTVRSIR